MLAPTALLFAASAAFAALGRDCANAYKPEYEGTWGVTYADWEEGCRQGLEDRDVLRYLLKNSVEVCARRYLKAASGGKIHETTIRAYCAQGPSGRARLSALTGIPERDEPPKPPEPPPAAAATVGSLPDKDFGLGPLVSALSEAKGWQPDACLSNLSWQWRKGAKQEPAMLIYRFYSRARWKESFVTIAGREGRSEVKGTANHCLTRVEVDLPGALERAKKAGLPVAGAGALEADLAHMDADLASANSPLAEKSGIVARLKGKSFWNVSVETEADGKESGVILDAVTGKVLYKGRRQRLHLVSSEPPK